VAGAHGLSRLDVLLHDRTEDRCLALVQHLAVESTEC
jgi:hypothetical protein